MPKTGGDQLSKKYLDTLVKELEDYFSVLLFEEEHRLNEELEKRYMRLSGEAETEKKRQTWFRRILEQLWPQEYQKSKERYAHNGRTGSTHAQAGMQVHVEQIRDENFRGVPAALGATFFVSIGLVSTIVASPLLAPSVPVAVRIFSSLVAGTFWTAVFVDVILRTLTLSELRDRTD